MNIESYQIRVPTAVLRDLRQRLKRTRWPDEIHGAGWDYGANLGYIKELVEYWLESFSWRRWERKLNTLPQFKANVNGNGIHFVHQQGKGPSPLPLMLIHGWPGSFFEMYKIIGPLSDPAKYGGDPADAFHIVVPSLPGYGFSDRPQEPGMNITRMAGLFRDLMCTLGYDRFG
ncbi:MAG: epoxide hydrolase, partial [Dehalococcoidia bacterium]|nr:epoxide hydrolase [Dehalococcoidia bacterium]